MHGPVPCRVPPFALPPGDEPRVGQVLKVVTHPLSEPRDTTKLLPNVDVFVVGAFVVGGVVGQWLDLNRGEKRATHEVGNFVKRVDGRPYRVLVCHAIVSHHPSPPERTSAASASTNRSMSSSSRW